MALLCLVQGLQRGIITLQKRASFLCDGEVQIGFGLGKYINRNVMDAYAGVSIGKQQRTVRTSRLLFPTPDETSVGAIHYEVLEPLKKIRIRLDENEQQYSRSAFSDTQFHQSSPVTTVRFRFWQHTRQSCSSL